MKACSGNASSSWNQIFPDNIKIIASVYPADLSIEADFAQVEQILINLIKNAVEALSDKKNWNNSPESIHMLMTALLIQVEDNGTGISG